MLYEGIEINIEPNKKEVCLVFKLPTIEQAKLFMEEMVEELKTGELIITLLGKTTVIKEE